MSRLYICKNCGNFIKFKTTGFSLVYISVDPVTLTENEVIDETNIDYNDMTCMECDSDVWYIDPENFENELRTIEPDQTLREELIEKIRGFASSHGIPNFIERITKLDRKLDVNNKIGE